mgnify:CR=1 FL=1
MGLGLVTPTALYILLRIMRLHSTTLVMIPVIYSLFDDALAWLSRLRRKEAEPRLAG